MRDIEALSLRIHAAAIDPDIPAHEVWHLCLEIEKAYKKHGSEKICLFIEREFVEILMKKLFDNIRERLEKEQPESQDKDPAK